MKSKYLGTCVEYLEFKEPMNFNLISSHFISITKLILKHRYLSVTSISLLVGEILTSILNKKFILNS